MHTIFILLCTVSLLLYRYQITHIRKVETVLLNFEGNKLIAIFHCMDGCNANKQLSLYLQLYATVPSILSEH